ncbi:MAG: hypothetical protein M1835_004299 [Candelina submexicana]|nr:MAG: hypothetical protein M1835_004299 [Candelina submexicana]
METTFISIHDLSLDARLLYASDSIVDILGYSPQEVVGKSCWEYFHPEEIPFAREVHGRGVRLDKAAVLSYCQIKSKFGYWVGCECVFTIVYDVLVAATSIYRRGFKSQRRALEAPVIRRLFSSSPRDPRYHMLSLLSAKFSQQPKLQTHEPRAALFLNRFSRTLTIMYATNALSTILGISPEAVTGKSFYYCIQENCLQEAVRCLEGAKANDSIAYLRFWFRDPRQDDVADDNMEDAHSSEEDDDDGGVHLESRMDQDHDSGNDSNPPSLNSRSSSGNSTDNDGNTEDGIFDHPHTSRQSSSSSLPTSEPDRAHLMNGYGTGTQQDMPAAHNPPRSQPDAVEVEAVVSCSSDGLVVILRRTRPPVPQAVQHPSQPPYRNGLFASPWASQPILPPPQQRSPYRFSGGFTPSLAPSQPQPAASIAASGPPPEDFMNSIREVAVFAWSLTGINGSLAEYGRGKPVGESQPPGGFPVWDPNWKGDDCSTHNDRFGQGGFARDPIDDPTNRYARSGQSSDGGQSEMWLNPPMEFGNQHGQSIWQHSPKSIVGTTPQIDPGGVGGGNPGQSNWRW